MLAKHCRAISGNDTGVTMQFVGATSHSTFGVSDLAPYPWVPV